MKDKKINPSVAARHLPWTGEELLGGASQSAPPGQGSTRRGEGGDLLSTLPNMSCEVALGPLILKSFDA